MVIHDVYKTLKELRELIFNEEYEPHLKLINKYIHNTLKEFNMLHLTENNELQYYKIVNRHQFRRLLTLLDLMIDHFHDKYLSHLEFDNDFASLYKNNENRNVIKEY